MTNNVGFFNFSINKILYSGQSILDAARVRLLYYGLALSFFTSLILFLEVLYKEYFIISIICGCLTFSSAVLFKYLTYRPRYRVISNIILIFGTLANIVNIYIAKQNADAITVCVIVLITLFSFNMLRQKAGFIYSALN